MSTFTVIFLGGIALLVIASIAALVHAVLHAEEGFEDSTGFHRLSQSDEKAAKREDPPVTSTVDTGNPWDQIEGASCPLSQGHVSVHQP